MNRYTVTIQSAHYGTWDYSGQPEEYLIQDEEKSTIQILNLILSHLILNKLKIGSNYDYFDESIFKKAEIIKELVTAIIVKSIFTQRQSKVLSLIMKKLWKNNKIVQLV